MYFFVCRGLHFLFPSYVPAVVGGCRNPAAAVTTSQMLSQIPSCSKSTDTATGHLQRGQRTQLHKAVCTHIFFFFCFTLYLLVFGFEENTAIHTITFIYNPFPRPPLSTLNIQRKREREKIKKIIKIYINKRYSAFISAVVLFINLTQFQPDRYTGII